MLRLFLVLSLFLGFGTQTAFANPQTVNYTSRNGMYHLSILATSPFENIGVLTYCGWQVPVESREANFWNGGIVFTTTGLPVSSGVVANCPKWTDGEALMHFVNLLADSVLLPSYDGNLFWGIQLNLGAELVLQQSLTLLRKGP